MLAHHFQAGMGPGRTRWRSSQLGGNCDWSRRGAHSKSSDRVGLPRSATARLGECVRRDAETNPSVPNLSRRGDQVHTVEIREVPLPALGDRPLHGPGEARRHVLAADNPGMLRQLPEVGERELVADPGSVVNHERPGEPVGQREEVIHHLGCGHQQIPGGQGGVIVVREVVGPPGALQSAVRAHVGDVQDQRQTPAFDLRGDLSRPPLRQARVGEQVEPASRSEDPEPVDPSLDIELDQALRAGVDVDRTVVGGRGRVELGGTMPCR